MFRKGFTVLWVVLAVTAVGMATGHPALAEEGSYKLTIRDHRFDPAELEVPAGKRVKLVVHNADPTPEEFESHDLKREKVIPGGGTAILYIGPLAAGTYAFVGEFHEDTAKGRIIVK